MEFAGRSLFDLDVYSAEEIEAVFKTAVPMKEVINRDIKKVPSLKGRTVATLFFENSTRTKMSFELAAKRLSADVVSFSASTSALKKGESLKDTVLTLDAMGIDLYIIRHSYPGTPQMVNEITGKPVLNAGDGKHAHPTQAVLDMFSIWEKKKTLKDLKIVIIGDINHSRVVRSNIIGMKKMGANVVLCGPSTLLSGSFKKVYGVDVTYNIKEAVKDADVIMGLRMQLERQTSGLFPSYEEYYRFYGITPEIVSLAKKDCLVMHPGPMNRGIEIEDSVADSPQSIIQEQVTNGVATRMSLLYLLLGGKPEDGGPNA